MQYHIPYYLRIAFPPGRILKSLAGPGFAALTGIFLAFTPAYAADELAFSKEPWTLRIDQENGALLGILWNKETISINPDGKPLVDWGPQWVANQPNFKNTLVSHIWDEKSGSLILHTRQTDWLVKETITLGVNGDPNLLGVSVELVYSPSNETGEPVKFDRVTLSIPIPKRGRYLLPGKPTAANYDGSGQLSSLKNGSERHSAWGIPPLLIESNRDLSLIFMPEYRKDIAGSSFKIVGDNAIVRLESRACGWAYPNEPQHIAPFYLNVFNGNLEQAFTQGVWKVYDDIGLKAVSDTPDWFRDAIIYSFHPGGTIPSGGKDLGGFIPAREELLPRLRQLGFDVLWMLPVEDADHIYWPRNYYKLQKGLGSEKDLKDLVDAAHGYGMKVLFDSVPHGGTPQYGQLRGNKPWELVFDENGNAKGYWCFDFGNPDWQNYMAKVTEYYMTKYGLDGHRIDAVIGSSMPNWRKKDFPSLAKTPLNIPEEWWRSSLEQNGGKLPPMPYERASLTCRQGGLEMLQAIKRAIKRSNPNGAVLAEVDHAPYMQDADAIYNFPVASSLKEARAMSREKWVANTARWLDELNFANPRGSRWLQYYGSHDHLSPLGLVGVNEFKALTAITMLIDGIPMIYMDQDIGLGIFLKKLIAVRKALPELRCGDGRYSTEASGVFASVRCYHDLSSIGLVNVNPDAVMVRLGNMVETAKLGNGRFAVWAPGASAPIAVGTVESLKSLKINLNQWEYEVLAFRPEGIASPFPAEDMAVTRSESDEKRGSILVSEGTENIKISAPAYSLSISKADGQIISFADNSENKLLDSSRLVMDQSPTFGGQSPAFEQPPVRPDAVKVEVTRQDSAIIIMVKSVLPTGSTVNLSYRCGIDSVKLDASLEESSPSPRLGIAFRGKEIKRWQVSSAEGLLDDFFTVRHANGTPSRTTTSREMWQYRFFGTPVMWQAETNPLAFDRPSILALGDGYGMELSLCDSLSNGLRNAMVLDKLGGKPGWYAAFFWRDIQPYPWKDAEDKTRSFTIVMKPVVTPLAERKSTEWTAVGNVKLRNVSTGWVVENGNYSIELLRCGGAMRSLRLKQSNLDVLSDNQIYTNKGFRTKYSGPNSYASSSLDGETGVRIWREGGRLHMLFSCALRGKGRTMLEPPVWAETEYVFDGSPSIKIRWRLNCDGKPKDTPAFLAWEISSDAWMSSIFSKDGKNIASGLSVKTASLKGSPLPDEIRFFGKNKETLLRLSDIRYPGNAPSQNVVVQDSTFYIANLDGPSEKVEPGTTYETSLTISVGQ